MVTGLVLSGGGVRGVSHLGVLKALDEENIQIDHISGTSAGAILGALYSYGYTPDFILDAILSANFFKLMSPVFTGTGMLSMDKIGVFLKNYLKHDSFEELKIPLNVIATDLRKGASVNFNSGELIKPILCSSCIPIVFKPVLFNGVEYVDGGILSNFPVAPIRDVCDFLIGSDCNFIDEDYQGTGFKSIIERSLLLAVNGSMKKGKILCDILIDPPGIKRMGVFEFSKAKEIFAIGYKEAKERLSLYKKTTDE